MKLYEAGKLRDDLLDMLVINVRNPRDFRGDLAAMIGSAHLGERRMWRLFGEFGWAVVEAAIEAILDGDGAADEGCDLDLEGRRVSRRGISR